MSWPLCKGGSCKSDEGEKHPPSWAGPMSPPLYREAQAQRCSVTEPRVPWGHVASEQGLLTTPSYSQSTSVKLGMKIDGPGDSKPQNGLQRPARRGGPWEGSWALVKVLSLPKSPARAAALGRRERDPGGRALGWPFPLGEGGGGGAGPGGASDPLVLEVPGELPITSRYLPGAGKEVAAHGAQARGGGSRAPAGGASAEGPGRAHGHLPLRREGRRGRRWPRIVACRTLQRSLPPGSPQPRLGRWGHTPSSRDPATVAPAAACRIMNVSSPT